MASVLEIINGISQVMANTYDGATDENGEPIKVGLKREEGHPINDSRVMDGFSVKMYPGSITIHYQAEVKLKDIHDNGFESEIDSLIGDIANFIKKEFKKITGTTLNLKPADGRAGEVKIIAQSTSKVRNFIQAHKSFQCSNLKDMDAISSPSEDRLEDNFRDFLSQGGWTGEGKDTKGASIYAGKGKVQTRKDIHSPLKAE